ncbi:MAG TPA: M28 family peptidase, partial [Chloroflexota bacterium]|nr:M28 family peptidase [Chloroflexota bacterium]
AHLRALCLEIGPRLSGTPGDERAVRYIADHFRRCGSQTEVQDFPCPAWDHEATELTLLGDAGPEPLDAVAQTFTEGCAVEAPLVGVASRHDLEYAPDLEGKVLLLTGDAATRINVDRNPTLLSAEERRPAALVVVSPAVAVSTKLIRDPFLRVPAVAVSPAVGERLRRGEGRPVRLRVRARRYASTGHNVVGRIPGDEPEHITVAAHYDTAAGVPGATDNASGTAVLLALCEAFSATGRRRFGVDFVAYGAEEYGRHEANLGDVAYVRGNPDAVRRTRVVVEVDCVGTVASPIIVHVLGWPPARRQEKESVLGVLRSFPTCTVDDRSEHHSARTAFNLPGVPALAFLDDYARLPIHTAQDTMDLMRPTALAAAADAVAATVSSLLS